MHVETRNPPPRSIFSACRGQKRGQQAPTGITAVAPRPLSSIPSATGRRATSRLQHLLFTMVFGVVHLQQQGRLDCCIVKSRDVDTSFLFVGLPFALSALVSLFFSRFAGRFYEVCSFSPSVVEPRCRVKPFSHEEHSAFLDAMERYGQESTGNEWEKIAQVRFARRLK